MRRCSTNRSTPFLYFPPLLDVSTIMHVNMRLRLPGLTVSHSKFPPISKTFETEVVFQCSNACLLADNCDFFYHNSKTRLCYFYQVPNEAVPHLLACVRLLGSFLSFIDSVSFFYFFIFFASHLPTECFFSLDKFNFVAPHSRPFSFFKIPCY